MHRHRHHRPVRRPLTVALAAVGSTRVASAQSSAQSSATAFGIIDVAARNVSNEGRGSVKPLVSGANNASRLGLRGSEDLGGGWSAGFHLEHGVRVDNGSSNRSTQFRDRRATISLVSRPYGETRAGRDFVPTCTAWVRHDPSACVGIAASSILLGSAPSSPASGLGRPPTVHAGHAVHCGSSRGALR